MSELRDLVDRHYELTTAGDWEGQRVLRVALGVTELRRRGNDGD